MALLATKFRSPALRVALAIRSRPTLRQDGIALVLVLCILVLLIGLIVAFLIDSTTDLGASKSFAEAARASLLANIAVNVVEGQITLGTAGADASGNSLAWASQPGMIRTYGTDGKLVTAYKLYSSDTLQQSSNFNLSSQAVQNEEVPSNWNQLPADFVDLNSPELISDPNGTIVDSNNSASKYIARFPVIDGNHLSVLSSLGTSPTGAALMGYDVTQGNGKPDIEGFSVQQPATYDNTKSIAPNNNPVPMPVRWVYVLQNGELYARDPLTGKITDATAANPVVGRIAFWTDDDTCKLNVNTASEGTFWDRPWAQSPFEVNLANFCPAQNEFQAFPGHPAKTCLSTVFGASWLWPVDPVVGSTANYAKWRPYYDLTPRVSEASKYGSAGGTQSAPSPTPGQGATGVPYDADRLYASIDEIMFKPAAVSPTPAAGVPARQPRNMGTTDAGGASVPAISPQFLETTRFFLTASNRAPEVTMFNTPRVSLWPIQADPGYRTAKDQLLAFCSTIPSGSSYPYYFQRATATHNLPGVGTQAITTMSCESPTLDMAFTDSLGRQRNQQIYSYLQQMMSSPVPGLGGSFKDKYSAGVTGQIISEMLDQIRAGVNTTGSNPTDPQAYSYTQPQPAALTPAVQATYYIARHGPLGNPGAGQVVPLQTSGGRGFGRFNTIVEAAVVFFRVTNPAATTPTSENKASIGAFLVLEPFNPTPGFPPWSPDMRVEVSGLDSWQIAGSDGVKVNLGFPVGPSTNIVNAFSSYYDEGANTEFNGLGTMFFYYVNGAAPQYKRFAPETGTGFTATDPTVYPFSNAKGSGSDTGCTINIVPPVISPTTGLVSSPSTCTLFGAPLIIKLYSNPTSTNAPELVQTLHIPFPTPDAGYMIQVPTYTHNPSVTAGSSVPTWLTNRLMGSDGGHVDDFTRRGLVGSGLIDPGDVVRSVIVDPAGPTKGDYRAISALSVVPANCFVQHPFYDQYNQYTAGSSVASVFDPAPANASFNRKFAHNLRAGFTPEYGGFGWYNYSGVPNVGDFLDKYTTPYPYSAATTPYPNTPNTMMSRKSSYRGSLVANLPTTASPQPAYYRDSVPGVAPGLAGAFLGGGNSTTPGDWDSGVGLTEDGAYVNKPDEGNSQQANVSAGVTDTAAYFNRGAFSTDTGQAYSPNRQISSAVAFGSLPTGIDPGGANIMPWQTLLFSANPAAGLAHPGFGIPLNGSAGFSPSGYPAPPYATVPDHAVLDLFTMPIVEPYAISEPLSTQGKVNMNYQIAPFTYIKRDTGVRAVMKSTWLTAVPTNAAEPPTTGNAYKQQGGGVYANQLRYALNPDEQAGTLRGFEDRFNSGDIFRSASEICGLPLVPQQIVGINQNLVSPMSYPATVPLPASAAYTDISNWWNYYKLTGDNLREEPYGDLYARLTTKSNTFTIHVRVQTLKKSVGSDPGTFADPADSATSGPKDSVTAEYRGSFQIERYVDPNVSAVGTNAFPDYLTQGISAKPIGGFYKLHTIKTKRF